MRCIYFIIFCFCISSCNAQNNTTNESFEIGGHQASFPGGEDSLLRFILDNLELPKGVIWKGDEPKGVSYARFSIDTLGEISDINIIKSVHPIYDRAIIAMIKKMPRWVPDSWKGEKFNSTITLPFLFGDIEED